MFVLFIKCTTLSGVDLISKFAIVWKLEPKKIETKTPTRNFVNTRMLQSNSEHQ